MFERKSRYAAAAVYTVVTREGTEVSAVRIPVRPHPRARGVHRRDDGQRLDLIAAHYLGDATGFWRLCDASTAIAPDALAERPEITVPEGKR